MQQGDSQQDFERRFLECDDKFNTIFELTSVASKIINADLIILKVNDALVDMLGYEHREIEGTRILEYACPEFKRHWHELQDALWSREIPFFKLRACLYRKDGSLAWVNVTTILFKDQGETYGFTVLDDVTGVTELEKSEKRLNMALRYSRTAIWEYDLVQNSVYRSDGHDEIFGYEQQRENWTIEAYYAHIWPDDLPKFQQAIRLLALGKSVDQQMRLVTSDGSVKWIRMQGRPETDPSGKTIRLLGTLNDITREKLIERHKDDFISIASHELRTPITSLKALLQLLDRYKDGLSDRIRLLIQQANKSINKIIALVDDLLNAGRTYNEQFYAQEKHLQPVQACRRLFFAPGRGRLARIGVECPKNLEITADAERIERVLINLLNNAAKYAPRSKTICIDIEPASDLVTVSVTDQGKGIAAEKIPLLFNRYYQGDTGSGSYSGLGLFISAEIIRKHGGDIGVDSEVDQGSTFWFTLPRRQAENVPAASQAAG
ncbi:hypothetical protein C7T94_07905 [Pedobacter yulinensis]|uniref:histidine kinase n=1 Tax=Pedobacter yulinensis TaxID=2126353 RepID=A0A2T3HJG9_9SPHI|nr:PAS domain-containing sensor histidine kinase [Pedobacter yulinensis]PST82582.1 hypothetical protein C7T94_07905 [Pedobacter yulinensis]